MLKPSTVTLVAHAPRVNYKPARPPHPPTFGHPVRKPSGSAGTGKPWYSRHWDQVFVFTLVDRFCVCASTRVNIALAVALAP